MTFTVTRLRKTYLCMETTSGRPTSLIMDPPKKSLNSLINPSTTKKRFSLSKYSKVTFCSLFSKTYDSFSMNDSSFLIHKVKESTGRVVMFKEYNIVNSFTLECSLCGPSIGLRKDYHYTRKMLFVTCLL